MGEIHRHAAMTPERKAVFIDALRKTGSPRFAARQASPHSTGPAGCIQSFGDERMKDPEFAAAWDAALDDFVGGLENEVVRRAMEIPQKGVYHQGKLIDLEERRADADRLLLRVLEKHDASWRPGRVIDGKVQVDVDVKAAILAIQAKDVLLLDENDRALFINLLEKIAELRGEDDGIQKLPGPSENGDTTNGP